MVDEDYLLINKDYINNLISKEIIEHINNTYNVDITKMDENTLHTFLKKNIKKENKIINSWLVLQIFQTSLRACLPLLASKYLLPFFIK